MKRFLSYLVLVAVLVCSVTSAKIPDGKRVVSIQTATSSAVSWSIGPGDQYNCSRIAIKIDSVPTTSEEITVTLDSVQGAAYDTVLRSVDPYATSATSIVFKDLNGQMNGDKLLVAYTNTDGNSVTGTATCEI